MAVFIYDQRAFANLSAARCAARIKLNHHIGSEGREVDYAWEPEPLIDLSEIGAVWRGSMEYAGISFSVDIIEKSVS